MTIEQAQDLELTRALGKALALDLFCVCDRQPGTFLVASQSNARDMHEVDLRGGVENGKCDCTWIERGHKYCCHIATASLYTARGYRCQGV